MGCWTPRRQCSQGEVHRPPLLVLCLMSQIHLNYESMENHLRMTQEVLVAEQEDHREI
jgi:hypothetical protein